MVREDKLAFKQESQAAVSRMTERAIEAEKRLREAVENNNVHVDQLM